MNNYHQWYGLSYIKTSCTFYFRISRSLKLVFANKKNLGQPDKTNGRLSLVLFVCKAYQTSSTHFIIDKKP